MIGIFNTIKINGTEILRPNDFELKREDVYAGEYTTMTGKMIADRIGWKYSDMSLKWDMLPDNQLAVLAGITGTATLKFTDSDGEHTESVIRGSFGKTATRLTKNGQSIWKDVELEIMFINTHNV